MSITRDEARELILEALELFAAKRPVPSAVTLKQAAEMLAVCPNTARKLNLPRNAAGLIPYETVLAARSSR